MNHPRDYHQQAMRRIKAMIERNHELVAQSEKLTRSLEHNKPDNTPNTDRRA